MLKNLGVINFRNKVIAHFSYSAPRNDNYSTQLSSLGALSGGVNFLDNEAYEFSLGNVGYEGVNGVWGKSSIPNVSFNKIVNNLEKNNFFNIWYNIFRKISDECNIKLIT